MEGGTPREEGSKGYVVAHPPKKTMLPTVTTTTKIRHKDKFLFTVTPFSMGRFDSKYLDGQVIGILWNIMNIFK